MVDTQDPAVECACRQLRAAARKVTRLYDDYLRPLDIRVTQFTVLTAIEHGAPGSISDLAEWLGMERTTLTRNLNLLENQGLVRMGEEGYRRSRHLELTRAGERTLEQARPLWRQAQQELEERTGADNWNRLRGQLDDLLGVL